MLQRTVSPGRYVRGKGVIAEIGGYCSNIAKSVYILGGNKALGVTQEGIVKSLKEVGIDVAAIQWYGGECSWSNIKKAASRALELDVDAIIGVGGGKALDTAKAASYEAGLPVITVPTIAATCAAWTPLSAVYSDSGVYEVLTDKAQNPQLVLADTEIIANAPVSYIRAGIGDTLAKWFEMEITSRNIYKNASVMAALEIAKQCYSILKEYSESAIKSVLNNEVTSHLEQVVDANIMLSGIVSGLGGDDCRTAAAHAIYSGLTFLDEVHKKLHGEIVAYGILCQLMLDKKPAEVQQLISFYQRVNLPYTLRDMNIWELSEQNAKRVGTISAEIEDMKNMPFQVTWQMVVDAILAVDRLGLEVNKGAGKGSDEKICN